MKLQPLGDNVIIKILEAEEKTAGGIIVPDAAKQRPQKGTVIAVGKGKALANGTVVEPAVKAGETVLFSKYSGNEIKIDDNEFLIVSSDEILAVV